VFDLAWVLCQASAMDSSRYLESLAADFALLRAAADAAGLDAPVPTCPGWTVADLVEHVAGVYLHKTLAMQLGDFPDERDWPTDFDALPLLDQLDRTYADLTGEFARRDPSSPAPTWYKPEPTVAFWIRRMAQETVIHRLDAELAAQAATGRAVSPVPDDIAADGVDEVLVRFLGYGSTEWPEEFAALQGPRLETAGGDDTVIVKTDGSAWTVRPRPDHVEVQAGSGGDAHAVVGAGPAPLLCWLWGRDGEEKVSVSGDPAWADYLRRLLVATTQ
jgi:uncharacterized protein (TIGR03083 family)